MPEDNPRKKSNLPLIGMGAALVLILAAGGFFIWKAVSKPAEVVVPEPPAPIVEQTSTYASSTMRVSLTHPRDFVANDAYMYEAFKGKPIHGVKFTVPLTMATGTNLSADSGISIEQLPRAKSCTGDIYLLANVKAQRLTEASTTYSVATSSEGAAGNLYEEMVYAIASSSPCTAVRYFIHSTNISNYDPGTVRAFDRGALMEAFDKIRRSIVFTQ